MTIAPIVKSVTVKAPPARAFDIFTTRISEWWPKNKTPAKMPHVAVVVEPYADGRWFERDANGNEAQWGKVLAYEPPARLVLGWQLDCNFGYDPNLLTEVEIRFTPTDAGGTLVTLEHRDLERFGSDVLVGKIRAGWPERLSDFVAFSDKQGWGASTQGPQEPSVELSV
jgi:uncharacterized protein YndB with AHSA1/START domain